MKKLLFNKIAVIIALATIVTACNKDFLNDPDGNRISTSNFWESTSDLNKGLVAVYGAFKDGSILRTSDETLRSDLAWPGYGRPNTSNPYYLQTFNDASNGANGKWAALYKGIFRANQVIEACDKLRGTLGDSADTEIDLIYAQARAFRGLFYFYLYTGFNNGAVPIFDFVPVTETDYYQPIKPATDVQSFYLADLEYGYANLPDAWANGYEKGRLTAGAMAALLGKSYLYEKDYATAATYFRSVIDDYSYALTPNIGSNFTTMDEFNEESILEISYSVDFKPEESVWSSLNTSTTNNATFSPVGGWRSVYPACWLNIEYRNDPVDTSDPRNIITEPDGSTRLRTFSLRTSWSVALPDDLDLPYYGGTTPQKGPFNNGETIYWRKFTNWDIVENEKDVSTSFPRSGINMRVIRLADVYLMLAECLIEGGNNDAGVDEALLYINKVRHRAAVALLGPVGSGEFPVNDHDNLSYTAQTLMDHLMYVERPLELSAEGNAIRTIDLRRWGVTKQRFEYLSQLRYKGDNFVFEKADGTNGTKWGAVISLTTDESEANPKLNEFIQPAQNYVESEHAYWPIPNSETTSNPKLNGNGGN